MDRLTERLEVAGKAQATLFAALENGTLPPTERRDVCILRFVYSFEATWKAAQAVLRERHGLFANSPRAAIRSCVDVRILDEATAEAALSMVEDRNLAAHTYNEELADKLFGRMTGHAGALKAWLAGLRTEAGA
ncbi:nucleotidyltransferase substrate binding protein [Roseospira navarrensis]|uniref:Nucleotidyltransferase n=1 Tax=Roseospira navarrensis TaxID=140058 RepID=A0A7X1ZDM2_9PROT|nr:nucleotidyltransferase substrate binding protein [Roseospira navarrensis]MQX36613.1 nucleotidyltransferase [Roseospira navarrensis]